MFECVAANGTTFLDGFEQRRWADQPRLNRRHPDCFEEVDQPERRHRTGLVPERQEVADRSREEIRRNRNLVDNSRMEECVVKLLLRYSFLCPRIAHPDAMLEHEAAEDIL